MGKLKDGQPIVPFVAEDLNGEVIDINDYQGQRLYLVFFRKAACPFCNMGLRELIKRHKELEAKGIKTVALFASSKDEILEYAGKQNAPFPIIPDGGYKIYEEYGVDSSYIGTLKTMFDPFKVSKAITGGFFSMKSIFQGPVLPADLLINEDLIVEKAHYGKTYDDHISVSEVLAWAEDYPCLSD